MFREFRFVLGLHTKFCVRLMLVHQVSLPVTTEAFAAHVQQDSPSMARRVAAIVSDVSAVFADAAYATPVVEFAGSQSEPKPMVVGTRVDALPQSDRKVSASVSWATVAARGADLSVQVPRLSDIARVAPPEQRLAALGHTLRKASESSKSYTEQLTQWLSVE